MKQPGELVQHGECLTSFLRSSFNANDWRWLFHYMLPEEKWEQMEKLYSIFYETDIMDTEELEARIYEFGSLLNEKDYLGRDLFVYLTSILPNLKDAMT